MKIFDTNILVYILRGESLALELLRGLEEVPLVSTVTIMELFHGIKNNADEEELRHLLKGFDKISVSESIAELAGMLLRHHRPGGKQQRHQEDIIIAATALHLNAELVTSNPKDFERIPGLRIKTFSL